MLHSKHINARLFFTYLKDKTELFLYIKPRSTYGSAMIYRRSPGDAAMNHRIQTLLDNAQVSPSRTDIWVMLFPPEIHTTTIYTPAHLTAKELRHEIEEQILAKLQYSYNYDWKNYIIQKRDNGYGQDMVTVTILGKHVLARIRSLLFKNYTRVSFIGDGMQFLSIDVSKFPHARGQIYEVILPYDEIYYKAVFRSGIHLKSKVLTHACSDYFGHYHLLKQQAYLDLSRSGLQGDLPQIQPIVPKAEWLDALLTPAAFPSWFVATNSLRQADISNFAETFQAQKYLDDPGNIYDLYPVPQFLN